MCYWSGVSITASSSESKYLLWLIDDLHNSPALVIDIAIQDAPALDGEGHRPADVGLEGVGCMPLEGH